ncbi:MAG: hypothetical protein ABSH20_28080 [Tepidisphaeraceae bacterium]
MPPGIYLPDATVGIVRVEDLPKAQIIERSCNYLHQPCPLCGCSATRQRTAQRTLHELGDPIHNRPRDLHVTYSQHYCPPCDHYFNADMLDLAVPSRRRSRARAMALACSRRADSSSPASFSRVPSCRERSSLRCRTSTTLVQPAARFSR